MEENSVHLRKASCCICETQDKLAHSAPMHRTSTHQLYWPGTVVGLWTQTEHHFVQMFAGPWEGSETAHKTHGKSRLPHPFCFELLPWCHMKCAVTGRKPGAAPGKPLDRSQVGLYRQTNDSTLLFNYFQCQKDTGSQEISALVAVISIYPFHNSGHISFRSVKSTLILSCHSMGSGIFSQLKQHTDTQVTF